MKQVILYSAHKQQVLSTDLSALHQFKYLPMQDMLPLKYSDEIIIQDQVEKIRLPIEKCCWQDNYGNRREILAAFDAQGNFLGVIVKQKHGYRVQRTDGKSRVKDTLAAAFASIRRSN